MAIPVNSLQLIKQLEKLNRRLSEIVARDFPILTEEQLNWKESEEKWSIAECLLHLNFVAQQQFPNTAAAIAYAKAKKSKPAPSFKRSWLGHRIVSGVRLGSDNQIKKPADTPKKYAPSHQTESHIDAHAVIKTFLSHQATLQQMLVDAQLINIQNTKVPVAFFGLVRINLGDMLKILVYHTERHIVQAQRVHYHDFFPGNTAIDNETEH